MFNLLDNIEKWFTNIVANAIGKAFPQMNLAPVYLSLMVLFRVMVYGSFGLVLASLLNVKQKIDKLFKWAQF